MGDLVTLPPAEEAQGRRRQMFRTALGRTITECQQRRRMALMARTQRKPVAHDEDELWSLKTVVARTGVSRSSIYSYIAQGIFPRQRRLGLRRVGWLACECAFGLGVGQFRPLPCADLLA
jgi:predicted DNA-binding transcriptional regulator AlpA